VEVGCGQGALLRSLAANAGPRLHRAIGFDPAFRSETDLSDSRIRVFKEFFNEQTVSLLDDAPSLVVSRHTIEHVAEPVSFLKAIRTAITDPGARLFVETPNADWIVRRREVEDLFYEHCTLLSRESMKVALQRAGFEPCKVELVFQDQYLWAEAAPAPDGASVPGCVPPDMSGFAALGGAREAFVAYWQAYISNARSPVIWGAGAKGVTFCTLIDPNHTRIAVLVDINPGKQKRYIPMTGHYVDGPDALATIAPDLVIVMNPNYYSEIKSMLADRGIEAKVCVLGENSNTTDA
jgi:hypothetical protein